MIRVAAVADLHCHGDCAGLYRQWYADLHEVADLLLIAGDLTGYGTLEEARAFAAEFRGIRIPMFAVLGNHDWHSGLQTEISKVLTDAGIQVLDGQTVRLTIRGQSVGVVGTKGFGGGFANHRLAPFGEPAIKTWVEESQREADKIDQGLRALDTDFRLVILHYAPVVQTIQGESPEVYPFLGCSRLAEPIDRWGAELVVHGHAHRGQEHGQTATGIPVRNVAVHVIQRYYALYELRPLAAER
jgi:Icc-related predicted phosphoesterase